MENERGVWIRDPDPVCPETLGADSGQYQTGSETLGDKSRKKERKKEKEKENNKNKKLLTLSSVLTRSRT